MNGIPSDALYYYVSPVGTLWIKPKSDGSVWLGMGGEAPVKSYPSAHSAAEEVRTHTTGIDEWDFLKDHRGPENLSGWMVANGMRDR